MKIRHPVLVIGFLARFACAAPPPPDEIDRAVRELGSREFSTREDAFRRLREWGKDDPEGIAGRIAGNVKDTKDPEVQVRCQALLREIDPSPMERLRREVLAEAHDHAPDQLAGLTAIGPFGITFKQAVNDLFDDPAPQKLGVLRNWARTHGTRLARVARAFADHEDPELRQSALFLAGDLQDPSLAPLLVPALDDPQPAIRIHALRALARWKDPASCRALPALLADPDENVREEAASIVPALETPENARELLAARVPLETDPYVMTVILRQLPLASIVPAHAPALARILLDPDADDEARQVVSAALLRLVEKPGEGGLAERAREILVKHPLR